MVVDNGGKVECDVVLCHANLSWNLDNLNLNIDLDEPFREGIDIDETWVNSAGESTELGD